MKKIFIILLAITVFGFIAPAQNDLKAKYDVKEYILDLNISNTSTEISGNVITNAVVKKEWLLILNILPYKTWNLNQEQIIG